jgi:hypothetical protein
VRGNASNIVTDAAENRTNTATFLVLHSAFEAAFV